MTKDYKAERRKARDAILEATLPHMVFDGWTRESLAAGASTRASRRRTRSAFSPAACAMSPSIFPTGPTAP